MCWSGQGIPLNSCQGRGPSLPRAGLLWASEKAITVSRRITIAAIVKSLFYPSHSSLKPGRAGDTVPSTGGQS